jgi:hypothetical protein
MMTRPEMTETRIADLKAVIDENPSLSRTQLSKLICAMWDWRSPNGMPKDISCRDMLRALEGKGLIRLPPPKLTPNLTSRHVPHLEHDMTPVECSLDDLLPLKVCLPVGKDAVATFKSYLDQYHYLGFSVTVGENMKYVVYSRNGAVVACLLFGSAAWSCRDRDRFIGWDGAHRKAALHLLTNNTRFWIPQWVKVPCLASHTLSLILRRLSSDWEAAYGHSLAAVETFVDRSLFRGVCYRAANWIHVGTTTGRGRDGGHHDAILPQKDVYLYPLDKGYREKLKGGAEAMAPPANCINACLPRRKSTHAEVEKC